MLNRTWIWFTTLCLACLAASCTSPSATISVVPQTPTITAEVAVLPPEATFTPVPPTATPIPQPSATPDLARVWMPVLLPDLLKDQVAFPGGVMWASDEVDANVWVKVQADGVDGPVLAEWVYVLAAPFPTVADEVSLVDLRAAWQGRAEVDLPYDGLLVDPVTRSLFEKAWGPAAPFVRTVQADALVDQAWAMKSWWAILPFEQIEPRWKVMVLDGQSPIHKGFDRTAYGLKLRLVVQGDADHVNAVIPKDPYVNYDPGKLTTVMLTGVTALVRGTGALMEIYGMEYPAMFIGDILREADILHINNEVPFWKTCPVPYNWEGLVFCSRTKYIQLLESIGTDVIELAGDHFQDWGEEAMLYTIDLYKERGWPYYGGGVNIQEAQSAARFEHNGNKIAFLGCNAKPPGYSGAGENKPGAVHCDFDQLTAEIQRQKSEGYLPIVTFQHLEYYSYDPHPILQADFARVAAAGAVIVSGSQAHQPHAMTFQLDENHQPAFLHYGLGNLFFDQKMFGLETSQAFLDRHIIYDGRYINTELISIFFVDDARARLMTPEERQFLLETIFKASGWQ